MEKYFSKRKQKFVAFVTAFFFLAANTGWSQNPVQISPVTELPAVSFSDPITIPDEIGNIQEEFNSGVGAPFVFFVQDAHAIIDAQNNIQALIDYLGERYDVSLVALEGGKGKLDPTLFRAFPDEKIKQKVFGDYLNRAEMTGAELAAILNSRETACYGIEDWKLYEANYLAYLKAAQKRDAILKELEALKADLDRRRKEIYSPKLNELHEKVRAFKEERSQLIELLKYLKGVSPEAAADGEAYPHLKTLFDSIAQDDSLDKEGLDVAIRDMAEYFRKKYLRGMKKGEVMDFNEKYQGFMTGRMDPATFLRYLLKTSGERGVKFKLTVQLQEFLGYADTLSTIKGTKIFDELERFLDVTEAGMAAKQEERELGGKYKRMDILKDLALLELNREKLREYQKEPEAYLSLVKDRRLFDPAIEFYRFAVGRDGMLRKNLRELMRKENAKAAVVILGGFHTLGFEEGLKESGCSYAVVTPKIRSLRGQEEYDAVMKGKLSYTDYLKTTFYDAFARHAGMKLVAELNEPDFKRILKFWRDELIRKLAAEGRVTEAGEYTKYIDLLVKVYIEKFGAANLASKSKEEILDDVRKALQDANENILSKWWGRFESELGAFMQGFRPLAEKNQVTSESVQTLLRDFGNSKPSNLQAVRAILSYQLSPAELKPFIDAALGKIDFSASEPAEYENVTRAVIVDAAVEALQKQIQPEGVSPEVVAKAEGVVRDILADQDRTVKAMPADVPQSFQASQKFVTGLLSRAEEGVRGETGLAEPQAVKLATLQALRNIQGEQTRESFTQEIPAAKPAPAVKAPENETNLSREAPRVARENQENASAKASAESVIRPEVLSSRHVADTAQSLGANATAKEQVLSRLMDVYVSFLKAGQKVLIDLPENIGNHYHAMGEIAERDGKLVVVTKGNYFDELEGLEYPLETITAITDVKPFIREREGRPFYVLYRVIWDIKDTGKFVGSVSDQGLFSAGLAYVGGDEEELGDFIARNFGFRGDTVDLLERVQDEAFPVTDEDGQAKFATPLMPFSADPSYAIRALKSGREDLAIVEVEVPPDQVVVDMDGGYGWQNKLRARLKENPGLLFANERDGYEAEYTSLAPRIPPQYIGMIYTKDGMVELAKRGEVLGAPESTDAASAETRHSAPTPMVGASAETPWFRHSAPTPMVGASLGDEDDWQAGEMPASDSPEAPRVSVGTFERIAALYDRAARLIRENPRVVRGDFLKLLDEAGEIPRGARTRFEWNLEKFDFDRDRVKRIQKELRLEGVSGQTFLPREIRKSKRLKSFLRETIGFDDVKESLRIEFMPDSIYVLLGAETYRRTHRSPKFSGVAMETQATRLDNSFGFFSTQNEGVWNGISLAGLLSFGKFEGEDPFGADPSTQTHEEFHKWQWTYSAGRETDSWTWPDEGRGIRFGILEEMAALMADQAGFAMDWDSFVRWFSSYAEDLGVEGDEATLRSFFDVLRIVQAFNWGRYLLEIAKRKESDVPVSPDEMIAAIEKSARSTAIRLEALSRSGEDEAVGDLWRGLMRGWARRTVWGALEKRIGGIFSKDPGDEARKKEIEAIRQSLDSEEAAWDIFSQWFGRVMGDFPMELSSGESSLLWENPHFTGAFFHAIMTRLGREVGRRFLRNVEGYMAKAPGLTGVSAVQMRKSLSEYLARTEDESPASAQSMGEDAVRGEVTGAVLESGENAQATASSLGALPVAVQGTAARITGAVEARRARKARDRELRRLILSYGRAESDETRTDIWGEVVGLIAGSDLEMIRGRTNGTVSEVRTAAGLMFRIGYSRMEGREVFEVRIPGAMGRFFDLVPEWGARFDSAIQNRFESLRNCVKYQAVVYQDVLSRNPPKGLSETRDISIKQLADIEDPLERIALRESLFLWFAQLWKECDPAGRAFVEAHREELVSAITDIVRQGVGVLSDFEFRTDYFVRIVSDRDLSDGDKMFFLNPGILGTVSKMRERENIRDIAHLITDSTVEINVRRTVAGSAYLLAVHRSILKKSAASETQRSEMLARFFNAAESFENCPAKDIDESPWVKGVLGVNCDLAQMEAFMSLTPEDVQAMLHPKVLEAVGQMTPNERSRAFEHIVLGKHPEVVRYGVECFGGEDFSVGTLKAYLIYYCNTQVLRDSRAEEFLLSAQLRDLTEAMGDGFSERMFKEGIDIALPSMVPIPYADAVKDLSAIAKNISAVAREISFKELDDLLPEPSELREEIFRAWYNKIIFHGKTDREGGVTSEQNKNLLAVLRYLLETHADEGAVKEFLRPLAVREYHEYRGQFVLLPLWTDRASIERMLGFGQAFTRTILKVLSDNVKNGSLRGNVRESVESFMTGYGTLFAELKGASKVVLVAEHLGRYFLRSEPRPSLIVDPSSLVGLLNQMDESGIGAYLHWLTGTESQEKRRENVLLGDKDFMDRILEKFPQVYAADFIRIFPTRLGKDSYLTSERDSLSEEERAGRFPIEEAKKRIWENLTENEFGGVLEALAAGDLSPGMAFAALMSKPLMKLILEKGWRASVPDVFRMISDESADLMTRWGGIYLLQEIGRAAAFLPGDSLDEVRESFSEGDLRTSIRCLLSPFASPGEAILAVRRDEAATAILDFLLKLDPPAFYRALRDVKGEVTAGEGVRLAVSSVLMQEEVALQVLSSLVESEGEKEDVRKIGTRLFYDSKAMFRLFLEGMLFDDSEEVLEEFRILFAADEPAFVGRYRQSLKALSGLSQSPQTRIFALPVIASRGADGSRRVLSPSEWPDDPSSSYADYEIDLVPVEALSEGGQYDFGAYYGTEEKAGEDRGKPLTFDYLSTKVKKWLIFTYLMHAQMQSRDAGNLREADQANREFAQNLEILRGPSENDGRTAAEYFSGRLIHGAPLVVNAEGATGGVLNLLDLLFAFGNISGEARGFGAKNDMFPYNVDLSRLGTGMSAPVASESLEGLIDGSTTGRDYSSRGSLGRQGALWLVYDQERLNNSPYAFTSANRATHQDHRLSFMTIPSGFVNAIILNDPLAEYAVPGSSSDGVTILDRVKKMTVGEGFYIPIYDLKGKLLFSAEEYDALREDYLSRPRMERAVDSLHTLSPKAEGSNPGGVVTYEGDRWYAKTSQRDEGQVRLEWMADEIYRRLGIPTPETRMVRARGLPLLRLARWVDAETGKGDITGRFVADVLLANGDISENAGNYMLSDWGQTFGPDNGGTFFFRAQGKRKGSDNTLEYRGNPENVEASIKLLESRYFPSGIDEEARAGIFRQISVIAEYLTDEVIDGLVDASGYDSRIPGESDEDLKQILKKRRDNLFRHYGYVVTPGFSLSIPVELMTGLRDPVLRGNSFDALMGRYIPQWRRIIGKKQHDGQFLSGHTQAAFARLRGGEAREGVEVPPLPEFQALSDAASSPEILSERDEALIAMGLHDLGKPVGDVSVERDYEHAIPSSYLANEILTNSGWHLPHDTIDEIVWVVRHHGTVTDSIRPDDHPDADERTVARDLLETLPKHFTLDQVRHRLAVLKAVNKADTLAVKADAFEFRDSRGKSVSQKFDDIFALMEAGPLWDEVRSSSGALSVNASSLGMRDVVNEAIHLEDEGSETTRPTGSSLGRELNLSDETGIVGSKYLEEMYSAAGFEPVLAGESAPDISEALKAEARRLGEEIRASGIPESEAQARELESTLETLLGLSDESVYEIIGRKKEIAEHRPVTLAKLKETANFLAETLFATQKLNGTKAVYLARDGGILYFVQDAIQRLYPDREKEGTLYYASRVSLGETVRDLVYGLMEIEERSKVYTRLFEEEKYDEGEFFRNFRMIYNGDLDRLEGNPSLVASLKEQCGAEALAVFRKAVDQVRDQLVAMGIPGKTRVTFVDTGYMGTMPMFMRGVMSVFPETFRETVTDDVLLRSNFDVERRTFEWGGEDQKAEALEVIESAMNQPFEMDKGTGEVRLTSPANRLRMYFERLLMIQAVLKVSEAMKRGDFHPQIPSESVSVAEAEQNQPMHQTAESVDSMDSLIEFMSNYLRMSGVDLSGYEESLGDFVRTELGRWFDETPRMERAYALEKILPFIIRSQVFGTSLEERGLESLIPFVSPELGREIREWSDNIRLRINAGSGGLKNFLDYYFEEYRKGKRVLQGPTLVSMTSFEVPKVEFTEEGLLQLKPFAGDFKPLEPLPLRDLPLFQPIPLIPVQSQDDMETAQSLGSRQEEAESFRLLPEAFDALMEQYPEPWTWSQGTPSEPDLRAIKSFLGDIYVQVQAVRSARDKKNFVWGMKDLLLTVDKVADLLRRLPYLADVNSKEGEDLLTGVVSGIEEEARIGILRFFRDSGTDMGFAEVGELLRGLSRAKVEREAKILAGINRWGRPRKMAQVYLRDRMIDGMDPTAGGFQMTPYLRVLGKIPGLRRIVLRNGVVEKISRMAGIAAYDVKTRSVFWDSLNLFTALGFVPIFSLFRTLRILYETFGMREAIYSYGLLALLGYAAYRVYSIIRDQTIPDFLSKLFIRDMFAAGVAIGGSRVGVRLPLSFLGTLNWSEKARTRRHESAHRTYSAEGGVYHSVNDFLLDELNARAAEFEYFRKDSPEIWKLWESEMAAVDDYLDYYGKRNLSHKLEIGVNRAKFEEEWRASLDIIKRLAVLGIVRGDELKELLTEIGRTAGGIGDLTEFFRVLLNPEISQDELENTRQQAGKILGRAEERRQRVDAFRAEWLGTSEGVKSTVSLPSARERAPPADVFWENLLSPVNMRKVMTSVVLGVTLLFNFYPRSASVSTAQSNPNSSDGAVELVSNKPSGIISTIQHVQPQGSGSSLGMSAAPETEKLTAASSLGASDETIANQIRDARAGRSVSEALDDAYATGKSTARQYLAEAMEQMRVHDGEMAVGAVYEMESLPTGERVFYLDCRI